MQVIYFILAIVLLVIWLGPYVLIIIVLWAIIALATRGRTKVNNKSTNKFGNNRPNNTLIKETITPPYVPRGYFEISRLQGEKIQNVIKVLMDKKDVNIYKIINRLESFHSKYFEKNNIYISDLYDYILRAANERIGTAKRDFVKRECKQVIQIITQLQDGNSTDDIVRAILSPKWNKVRNESVATDIEENRNEFDNEQCHEQSDNRQDNGWKVIENLENHPLLDREYCQQLHKRVEVLHQNGELDKEIRFIRETIQSYESVGLPCKYWRLLFIDGSHC